MRISLLFTLCLMTFLSKAQTWTTNPAIFSANESVTFTVDVSGDTKLMTLSEAWAWVWAMDANGTVIGSTPTNINPATAAADAAKFQKVAGTNKWTITFVPATMVNLEANKVIQLGILLKAKDWGGGQTTDKVFNLKPVGGIKVVFTKPTTAGQTVIVNKGDVLNIQATASESVDLSLKAGETVIKEVTNDTIETAYTVVESAPFTITVLGKKGDLESTASFSVLVRPTSEIADLPAGVKPGINYHSDQTKATLVLQAPKKDFVYVIGDFNDWKIDSKYLMKKTSNGEHFWIELSGLTAKKEYIFQYLVDGSIRIADFYADKISDPFDDKFIDAARYPGLLPYPDGKTTERASYSQTGQTKYKWEVDSFKAPNPDTLMVYELLIRDFLPAPQNTYKGVMDSLDYIKRMGFNAIHFMPVNEFEGNLSWGYNRNFYFAPDKFYGHKDEFKKLVDACHKKGIAVVIDLVLNHSFNSSPMVRLYWDGSAPSADNPWFNSKCNFTTQTFLCWGSDFNHESAYTKAFVDSVTSYWLQEYKVDGFRFDFTKGFTNKVKSSGTGDEWGSNRDDSRIAILKRMVDHIWAIKSDALVIFEHLTNNEEEKILGEYGNGIMCWGNLNHDFRSLAKGTKASINWSSYKERGWGKQRVLSYMESHDEQRLMYDALNFGNNTNTLYNLRNKVIATHRGKLLAAFHLLAPGPKMVWQFGERGYDVSIDENGRTGEKPSRWEYMTDEDRLGLYGAYAELVKLSQNPVFNTTNFTYSMGDGEMKWIKFNDATKVLVVGNFSLTAQSLSPGFQQVGTWYDYATGETLNVTSTNMSVPLMPGEVKIYSTSSLRATPALVLGTPLAAPTDLAAAASTTNVRLTWKNQGLIFADGLVVERSENPTSGFVELGRFTSKSTESYIDSKAAGASKTYYYRVGSYKGSRKSFSAVVSFDTTPLSSADDLLSASLTVYPNPSNGQFAFRLQNEEAGSVRVSVLNLLGQRLYERQFEKTSELVEQSLDLRGVSAGIYLFEIRTENARTVKQIVIE